MFSEMENRKTQLTTALQLAAMAPSDALSEELLDVAKFFAHEMDPKDVDLCLKAAELNLELMKG